MLERLLLIAVFLLVSLAGCGGNGEPDLSIYEGADTYRVRGVVVHLPDRGPPPRDLKIHHEHIPGFIGKTGEVHINSDGVPGMKAMAMDFPEIARDVSLEGLGPGDKVVFEFKVRWVESPSGVPTPRWLVSALEPLPADAEISFENKVGAPEPFIQNADEQP